MQIFAILGTVGIIIQMALLAIDFDKSIALSIGFAAAICWIVAGLYENNRWLIATNVAVGCFALYGVI